ncbi:NAD-dependent epimerase/dehydratase family protein [Candidatus Daviesbacteria bacterium]|nr:NAD-dependent epimerase/dehydratase family protein [Candidatus Daviesbacteria bacterium]
MKIAILDSDSFFGKNMLKILPKNSYQIYPLSKEDNIDFLSFNSLKMVFKKIAPDVIFNFASHLGGIHYVSKYQADVVNDNMQMVLSFYKAVLASCPKAKVINPMSNCSYPGDANIHQESDWWMGEVHESVYAYGNAKRMQYVVSCCYKKQYGIKSLNFLVPNYFGPGDETDPTKVHALPGMIIRMIKAHREKASTFEIWGTGKPIREWGYIDDLINILIKGITLKEDLTYPVNIAQNKGYSIRESAKLIAKAIGYKGKLTFNTNYPDGAAIKVLDNRKFKSLFPNFKFTDHKKAIQETVKYYLSIL